MNCKPGDLAVIVKFNPAYPHMTGKIVDVIELSPVGVWFNLPNGKSHKPCGSQSWIIKFPNPVDLSAIRGRSSSLYAVCPDHALRPLRDPGEDAEDEMLLITGLPERKGLEVTS